MKTLPKTVTNADYFFGLLSNLNSDIKLDLISKLSNSLKSKSVKKAPTLDELFGAFKSDKSADEIIKELKKSRTFTRKVESL